MECTIRQAIESDIENIAQLESKCFSFEGWSSTAIKDGIAVGGRHFFVATDGVNHVGHGCITNIYGEGEITNIAVDEKYRRFGIGRKLLEALLAFGRDNNCERFTLEVRESNNTAIKLYESFGFVSAGIRPHFYNNPDEGAVIMWL